MHVNRSSPSGLRTLKLKAGAEGAAKVSVGVKGPNLALDPLPYTPRLTVQLKASNGMCWDAAFNVPTKNDASQLKAKSD